jgi:maltose alpha-D-glucosyltransferase / alpha-amylase
LHFVAVMFDDLWYKNALIYSLDLETFMDSNGDGVGDFEGLIRRLDYLDALGVDVLWIAPFQKTPNRDNGYDISDYYTVDPRHGSGGDFVEFMQEAKKRGMRVIIDLVANHTSIDHPWFQASRKKDERYHDWYVWSKKRPPDWNKGMVFPGVQHRTWTYDKERREYYFHRFYEHQPDLNMDNPAVRAEIRRIMGFWLELGVAGFRVDAVPFIIERPKLRGKKNGDKHFDFLEEMRDFLQWRSGDAVLLGEANVLPEESKAYFADGQGLHLMFNFWVNQHLFYALASSDTRPLLAALRATKNIPPGAQWAQFLRNHDELDIDRLTEEQRQTVFDRFGPEPEMQIYERGIRRRLASMLGDRGHGRLAHSVLFSLPGTPVIRYGDEIGMGEDLSLKERDAVRTPMQWSDDPSAGFSAADKLIHPVIDKGAFAYRFVNVESQRRDPDSNLRWMRRLIALRKECPEIGWGEWKILPAGSKHLLALLYTWRGTSVLVVHNFASRPLEARIRIEASGGGRLVDLNDPVSIDPEGENQFRLKLDEFGSRWFRLGNLNYALERNTGL